MSSRTMKMAWKIAGSCCISSEARDRGAFPREIDDDATRCGWHTSKMNE